MNEDILKGKWLAIRGRIKEKWGKLTDNDFGEIEGKIEKLLGLLQKKYGCIRDKAELEYQDSIELAEIVTRIREILGKKNNIRTIAFIARYGQSLSGKKQQIRIIEKEKKHGNDTDRYFDTRLSRRNTHLAPQ
jgi:uncharacterized protein YjbJ (UPF0337 family)